MKKRKSITQQINSSNLEIAGKDNYTALTKEMLEECILEMANREYKPIYLKEEYIKKYKSITYSELKDKVLEDYWYTIQGSFVITSGYKGILDFLENSEKENIPAYIAGSMIQIENSGFDLCTVEVKPLK